VSEPPGTKRRQLAQVGLDLVDCRHRRHGGSPG
jgi:hypothetical protein